MKKKLLVLFISLFMICACQTQEKIKEEKEKKRIDEITKEVNNSYKISEDAKKWLVDNKSTKVLTILCIKTSNRCNKIKDNIKDYEKKLKVYYIELDDLEDNEKDVYKKTYELKDYTGYLPYIYLVNNNKLIDYNKDIKSIDDIKDFLIKNKIVSE